MGSRFNKIGLITCLCVFFIFGCGQKNGNNLQVVVYTSVDQVFSEQVFQIFEEQTGIEVLAVYDVEASKTTGLVNRLIAEQENPQADVFWNGEFAQTLLLKEEGVLQPYASPQAENIPAQYRDDEFYWTGFAGRARVILVNTDLVSPPYPDSIMDLLDPAWNGNMIGIAYPLFGTTATQAAALYAYWGPDEARDYFQSLVERNVRVLDGNSVIRDQVAAGELAFGMTDTDDACGAVERGAPVKIVFPDQGEGEMGTLIIPNTVGLIAGAPNKDAGEQFIDFLLSEDTARLLIQIGWSQVSLRGYQEQTECLSNISIVGMPVNLSEIYDQFLPSKKTMQEIFIR